MGDEERIDFDQNKNGPPFLPKVLREIPIITTTETHTKTQTDRQKDKDGVDLLEVIN